jgi:hypothetical protein
MEESGEAPRDTAQVSRPLQYSLSTLFVVMTVLAVVLSLLVTMPPLVRFIAAALFVLSLPMVLTVVLIYGRGLKRTFCIGALFPSGLAVWLCSSGYYTFLYAESGDSLAEAFYVPAIYVGISYTASFAFGVLAILARVLTEVSPRRNLP